MARPRLPPRPLLVTLVALLLGLLAPELAAQGRPPAGTPAAATAHAGDAGAPISEVDAAPDSPRAAIRQYVALCREGEYTEAARFLDAPPGKGVDAAGLARRLKVVLDRHLWGESDLALMASPLAEGNKADKLPGIDELGTVPGPKGPEPVRIVRRPNAQALRWL